MEILYKNEKPDKNAFFKLYETTGWNLKFGFDEEELAVAVGNSYFLVCAYNESQLIGFGRLISDGIYQTFIGDMIVHPDFQHNGIGSHILSLLLEKCRADGLKWIQLTSAKGKSGFYKKFGFTDRPSDAPGMQLYL